MSSKFQINYRCLDKQVYEIGQYSFVPIRYEDRFQIMKWRNEQMYHLRQTKLLNNESQNKYFSDIIKPLFDEITPSQILFSYLKNGICLGYGGLVHINWVDRNAELSFLIDTSLENTEFDKHYTNYLKFIEILAFEILTLHKVYSYAFDLRPHLYSIFEKNGYNFDAKLSDHVLFNGSYIDVIIHCRLKK